MLIVFELLVFLFSIIIHEVSHGLMAYKLGDPTAKDAGRLTFNPFKHLDLYGSIILPLIVFLFKR
jgi:Zn-dependent protease